MLTEQIHRWRTPQISTFSPISSQYVLHSVQSHMCRLHLSCRLEVANFISYRLGFVLPWSQSCLINCLNWTRGEIRLRRKIPSMYVKFSHKVTKKLHLTLRWQCDDGLNPNFILSQIHYATFHSSTFSIAEKIFVVTVSSFFFPRTVT